MARTIPVIPQAIKDHMKTERLNQYHARIFSVQMDIAAYQAISDDMRIVQAQKNLDDLITSYYAVEAMV